MNQPPRPYAWLKIVPFCGEIAIWILFLVSWGQNYNYTYPAIQDVRTFLLHTIPIALLPLIPIAVGWFFSKKQHPILMSISLILFIPVLAFSLLNYVGEILFFPSVCSYTSDVRHLGQYDERPQKNLSMNPVPCFPKTIDPKAQDVQYCYFYENASAEYLYIAVSWKYEDPEAFEHYLGQLPVSVEKANDAYSFSSGYYQNALLIDRTNKQICFLIGSPSCQLPTTMEEVFHADILPPTPIPRLMRRTA